MECNTVEYGLQRVADISLNTEEKLMEISEFLRVKATQNVVLGSYPFAILETYFPSLFLFLSSLFNYFFYFYLILNLSLTLSFLINCNRIVNTVFKDINGLVHFIHINRSNGRVIAPIIDVDSRRGSLIKQQVIIIIRLFIIHSSMTQLYSSNRNQCNAAP